MTPTPGFARLVATAVRHTIPLEVSVELSHRCNLSCRHCYLADRGAPGRLPTTRLRRLLDELAAAGTLFLALSGGEPLLEPDWLELARAGRELGCAVTLLTNGTLIDEGVADAVAELDLGVHVTIFGLDPAVSDAITGVRGAARRTRAGVEALRARGVEVLVKTPLTRLNVGADAGVAAWASALGADFQAFPDIVARSDGDPAPLALRLPAAALPPSYATRSGCPSPDRDRGEGPPCAAGVRYCAVSPGGDLLACNLLRRSAGNLRDRSFRDVWESSPALHELRRIRRADLPACASCPALPSCSRCPAQALLEDGDLRGPSRRACERAGVAGPWPRRSSPPAGRRGGCRASPSTSWPCACAGAGPTPRACATRGSTTPW
jgi:radical SAM protein with 4Fe4S-binding SPASM domain